MTAHGSERNKQVAAFYTLPLQMDQVKLSLI
jgi:hypothetical protein